MFPYNSLRPSFIHTRPALADADLQRMAPSVFASAPVAGVSDRYAFVPTAQIVSRLRDSGWVPVSAGEQRVRLENRRGFQKHLLRFQRVDILPARGEYTPELILINSHDRSSAYQLHAGLFRFVCGNGLVIADATFQRVTLRHSGFTPEEAIEASCKILDGLPAITASVEAFRARQLTPEESTAFARRALAVRFEGEPAWPITPPKLLEARRPEDRGDDLWHTLNRTQENLLQGGQRDRSRVRPDSRWFGRMRAVTGLDQNVRINKELWELARRLAAGESINMAE